jgi:hypothetical protein
VELPRKELEFGIRKPYLLFQHKGHGQNMSIMKYLCLFLVNAGTVVCIIAQILQFCQLKFPVRACFFHVEVELLDYPKALCSSSTRR